MTCIVGCVSGPVSLCVSIVHQSLQWDSCHLILTLLLEELKLFFKSLAMVGDVAVA